MAMEPSLAPEHVTSVDTMESSTTGHWAFASLFATNRKKIGSANESSSRKARFISICYLDCLVFLVVLCIQIKGLKYNFSNYGMCG